MLVLEKVEISIERAVLFILNSMSIMNQILRELFSLSLYQDFNIKINIDMYIKLLCELS